MTGRRSFLFRVWLIGMLLLPIIDAAQMLNEPLIVVAATILLAWIVWSTTFAVLRGAWYLLAME